METTESDMMSSEVITGDCLDAPPLLPARAVNRGGSSPPAPGQMGNGQSVGEWLPWLGHVARRLRSVLAPSAVVALNATFQRAGVPSGAAWAGAGYLAVWRGSVPGVAQQEV